MDANLEYICSECNSIVNENDKICSNCGADLGGLEYDDKDKGYIEKRIERIDEINNNSKTTKRFCSNCGSIVNPKDKFCSKCGFEISEENKIEYHSNQKDRNNFLNKYKPGIILFTVITFFMLLFPPIEWGFKSGSSFYVRKTGYYFLLNFPDSGRNWGMHINEAHISSSQLFVQIILVAILAILFQYFNAPIRKWWKSNF